ncbi:DNA methyltransferase [Chitinivorax sp. PXF-14]|uniref:DNA methyltransferase n=1 Tax=Chitinivorax sp. PXF-14 TaxID=3230488 RepID=UPI0034665D5A
MLAIENPKQSGASNSGRVSWFPYYAGYSPDFVRALLNSAELSHKSTILDPWNGAGTTTMAALELGYESIGFDLNPAMVVAAKARSINPRDCNSLSPLAADIIEKAGKEKFDIQFDDPLTTWLYPQGAGIFRRIDIAIQKLLLPIEQHSIDGERGVNCMSDIAAFFYTAMFRVLRDVLKPFIPSNPTWTKRPNLNNRLSIEEQSVFALYIKQVNEMASVLQFESWGLTALSAKTTIATGTSEALAVDDSSIDMVVTSPPYCTRIDYAVATMPELAILGYRPKDSFQDLRRKMIGTSTVPVAAPTIMREWGEECLTFLERLRLHDSKASSTYYYKSHAQYYASIYNSLKEIARVMKDGGKCVLVVQDSYYKEIHNNLPLITAEMFSSIGLKKITSLDFPAKARMGNKHPSTKKYGLRRATESVICLQKSAYNCPL